MRNAGIIISEVVRETDPAERQLRHRKAVNIPRLGLVVRETDPAERQLRPGRVGKSGGAAARQLEKQTQPKGN